MKADTILQHLIDYHQEGHDVDVERLLSYVRASEAERGQVFAWFEELGATYLRPVFDALESKVSFDDLRLLRIYYLSRKSPGRQTES